MKTAHDSVYRHFTSDKINGMPGGIDDAGMATASENNQPFIWSSGKFRQGQ